MQKQIHDQYTDNLYNVYCQYILSFFILFTMVVDMKHEQNS